MAELPATLTGLQRALGQRQISGLEAIAAQRARLDRMESQLHCVVQTLHDEPRDGALAGIGLAHKDIFDSDGRRPGVGHDSGSIIRGLKPAPVLARLRQHGASQLAALSMTEYACGATGENHRFERCVNPLQPQAAVGGSSSGSAVAVASEMAYGSLGTDTAGSVRIPAATCALLGLKTTHGLLPLHGVHPLAPALDSVGILTRSAADAAVLLEATAESELLRPAVSEAPRIKAWIPEADLHPSVAAALEEFARDCGAARRIDQWSGHQTLTHLAEIVLHVEAAGNHRNALLEGAASPAVRAVALPGLVIPPDWYRAALADRARRARAFVDEHLREFDIFLIPALPHPAPDWDIVSTTSPDFDARQLLALHRYMSFVNYLGFPSVVFPVARDARGMPISVQLIGRPFHERNLLAFAHRMESLRFGSNGFTRPFLIQG